MGAGGAPQVGGESPFYVEPSEVADTELEGPKERPASDMLLRVPRMPRRLETMKLVVGLAPLPRSWWNNFRQEISWSLESHQ